METYTKVAKWHENPLVSPAATATKAEYDAQLAAKKKAVDDFVATADKAARDKLAADAKPPEKLETLYPEETKAELAKLREALAVVEKNPPDLPAAMGVAEDTIVDLAIHIRGNPLKLGDVIPRHTPPVVRGPQASQFSSSESGRRQLADWLIDPQHPLTSRVIVNRVWRWHFGTGLVRTTDNFGLLGEAPSHPELLDWLARRFVADGWSFKSLHRVILNSRAYQLSSLADPALIVGDPENRLFGRANVRRLEAEEVRDALLQISGKLDPAVGGSLLKVKNRGYLFDHTSIDLSDYTSQRRSLYLPVIRNNLFDLFQLLDFPDPAVPSGDRAMTTVAPQALLMLNSDFVMQSADELAKRLLSDAANDNDRLSLLSQVVFGRDATAQERDGNLAFVARVEQSLAAKVPDAGERRRQAWSVMCHVAIASNEFVYIR